jgi:hypothetical protein
MALYLMWMSIYVALSNVDIHYSALSNVDVHYGALPIVSVHLWCST